jgi:hypothetical protein
MMQDDPLPHPWVAYRFLNSYHDAANTALCAGIFGGIVSQLSGAMPVWVGFLAADVFMTAIVSLSIALNQR